MLPCKVGLRGRLHERVSLSSRVTLGSRVSHLLCVTQFVLHRTEGAPWGKVSLQVGKPYMVGTSFFYISPCKTQKLGGRAMFRCSQITAGHA